MYVLATKIVKVDPQAYRVLMERTGQKTTNAALRALLGLPPSTAKKGWPRGKPRAKKKG